MTTYAQRLRDVARCLETIKTPTDQQRDEWAAELHDVAHALGAPNRTPRSGVDEATKLVITYLLNGLTEYAAASKFGTREYRLDLASAFMNEVIEGLTSNALGRSMELLIASRRPRNRDLLVLTVADAAKRWWITARDKAKHGQMDSAELKLWQATRDLKKVDGEATP